MSKKKPVKRAAFATPSVEELMSPSAARAFGTLVGAVGRDTTKANRADLERRKAMANALPGLIETLNEDMLTAIFFGLEDNASKSDAKKIATHPLRPAAVDDLHAKVAEEREAARLEEEEEARKAKEAEAALAAKAQQADQSVQPTPKTDHAAE